MYDGARAPSPQDGANGFPKPGVSTGRTKPEEEGQKSEPVPAKKAHREILDHERKRRVELKCMELQEMMEEQGYPEDEIQQKVGTFRQMLMEKEGVITREGSHRRQVMNHMGHSDEEDEVLAEGYAAEYDCHADYYDRDSVGHGDYRMKRKSSSSLSPPPKKRKKKKSGHRRSRFDSSSPPRREKKKKSGKKHKRDRYNGSNSLLNCSCYRSESPKNKHKDKNKPRKRSPLDSPNRRSHHRGSCCSSRSASVSSTGSHSKSPSRPSLKQRVEGYKARQSPSSQSTSLSPACGPEPSTIWQNGHRDGSNNGSGPNHVASNKQQDKLSPLPASPSAGTSLSPHLKDHQAQGVIDRSPGRQTDATSGDEEHRAARRSSSASSCKRRHRHRAPRKSSHSPAHSSDSSSQHSQDPKNKGSQAKKARGIHSSKRRRRSRLHPRHRSPSASSGRHRRHASGRKESSSHSVRQRSSSWSSGRTASRSRSREHGSKAKSPHFRQNHSREKDGAHHTDAESRTRRRSRSYSPIRKRRRDSPSFMEARRITSARKRPIPYYRPSPSSSSSMSSHSTSSRSHSRSYYSYSSYSHSRSQSRSRSRSPSRNHSYYSRSSSESPGF
ncbi:serine/arginine repetitive matrix protein 3-like [Arapaima gigas]